MKQMLLPALAVLLLTSRIAPPLFAQGLSDVLGKKSGSASASSSSADASARIGKDRVDLSLSPSFASSAAPSAARSASGPARISA